MIDAPSQFASLAATRPAQVSLQFAFGSMAIGRWFRPNDEDT